MILRKVLAFVARDFRIELSYRFAFFLRFLGIFFSVATFFFIAKLFGSSVSSHLEAYNGDYFAFVLIGIAFSGFLSTGLSTFATSIRSAQAEGTLEAMLVTPTRLATIVLSSSLWSFFFTSLTVLVYLAFGVLVFGAQVTATGILPALLVLLLTIVTFSGLGIVSASFIMVLKRGDPVSWIFGSVSSLMGGTYFPVTVLPAWLQKFSYLFPIFYSLRAMRLALLSGASFGTLVPDILALVVIAALVLPLSAVAFNYAVKRAKIDGTLATY